MGETKTGTKLAFGSLAALGAIIWLVAIGLHIAGVFTGRTYEIDHIVLLIGGLFGFVGFYGLDSKRAREGGAFIVDSGVKILGALPRFGRRSTDAIAVPSAETRVRAVPTDAADEAVIAMPHREPEKGE